MKRKKIVQAAFVFIACAIMRLEPASSSLASPAEQTGKVVGVVFDVNDARVAGATVIFKNQDFERKVITGEAGEFKVELPVTMLPYSFTVEAHGFCIFDGELLRVRPKTAEMVNIHLEVQVTHTECRCSSRRTLKSPNERRPQKRRRSRLRDSMTS